MQCSRAFRSRTPSLRRRASGLAEATATHSETPQQQQCSSQQQQCDDHLSNPSRRCSRSPQRSLWLTHKNKHKSPWVDVPTLHHHHHHHEHGHDSTSPPHQDHGHGHHDTSSPHHQDHEHGHHDISPSHQKHHRHEQGHHDTSPLHQLHHHHEHGSHATSPLHQRQRQHRDLEGEQGLADDEAHLQILCEDGQLDKALDIFSCLHTPPSINTYLSLLKACIKKKALPHAKQIHAHLTQHSLELSGFLGDYLVVTLAKCGAIDDARQLSSTLPCLTVFSGTAMISAYVDCGCVQEAFKMHQYMQENSVEPNTFTFVSLFKACGSIQDLEQGKKLHADARRKGFASDVFVGSTLVTMYGKCGAIVEAEDVFIDLSQRNIVSWNAMLSAYVDDNQGEKALHLYRQMHYDGVMPDQHTLLYALQACGTLAEKEDTLFSERQLMKVMSLEIGQALHADVRVKNLASNVFVGTALLSVYAKCGAAVEAADVFSKLTHRDTVSWNAMLSAYVHLGEAGKALQLYKQMQKEGMSPDQLTPVFALQACGNLAEKEEALFSNGQSIKVISLGIGQAVHADAQKKGFVSDLVVCNTLLSMYGKCGAVMEAEDVFGAISHRDVVSWTAMLSAYVEHGQAEKAFWLYKRMQKEQLNLDDITLVCILQVCSESGNLEMCKQLHFDIISVGYDQISFTAATLTYTYGSCASMVDAQAVFDELSGADIVSWNACIAGHAAEGDYIESLCMFEKLLLAGTKPDEVTFSSVLAACRHTGLVMQGIEHFEAISRDYGIIPNLKHYASMLDLLGRAGDLESVENMLKRMPMQADLTIWLCLLGACRAHGNVELAKKAFDHAVNLQPKLAIAYVLMANTYADAGLQDCAAEVEKSRQQQGAWGKLGQSWMEQEEDVYSYMMWE